MRQQQHIRVKHVHAVEWAVREKASILRSKGREQLDQMKSKGT